VPHARANRRPGIAKSHFRALPTKVIQAAEKALPGLKLNSYNSEIFGTEPAWELRGYDAKGHFQRLDISDSGEVILIEPD
jgi:hypothetical protein